MLYSIEINTFGATATSSSSSTSTSTADSPASAEAQGTEFSRSIADQLQPTLVEDIAHSLGINKFTLWRDCNQDDLVARHLIRARAYDQVVRHYLTKIDQDDAECVTRGFAALKPFLSGAYADGQISQEDVERLLQKHANHAARLLVGTRALIVDFLDTLTAIYAQSIPLPEMLIEAVDVKHRPAAELMSLLNTWADGPKRQEFFTWLNQDGRYPHPDHSVNYLTVADRAIYKATFLNGKIVVNGSILDTTRCEGKQPGRYAYAMTCSGELLISPHVQGQFQHSSFSAMGPIICMGMIRVNNGLIEYISNHSGHYRPTIEALRSALKHIPTEVFADKVKICSEEPKLPGVINWGVRSPSTFFHAFGHLTRSWTTKSHCEVHVPISVVRAIGSRFESAGNDSWSQSAIGLAETNPELTRLELGRFLQQFNNVADKLACLGKLWHYWYPRSQRDGLSEVHLFDKAGRIPVTISQKSTHHLCREYYRALLMAHINVLAKDNIIIQLFNEQKRRSYGGDVTALTPEVILAYLERYPEHQRLDQLEQALAVISMYPDFDATETPYTTFCGDEVQFSAKQLQEIKLILDVYTVGRDESVRLLPGPRVADHRTLIGFLGRELKATAANGKGASSSSSASASVSSTSTTTTEEAEEDCFFTCTSTSTGNGMG